MINQDKHPLLWIIEDLHGIRGRELALILNRSQNQISMYRNNHTAIPPDIERKLKDTIRKSCFRLSEADHPHPELIDCILKISQEAL